MSSETESRKATIDHDSNIVIYGNYRAVVTGFELTLPKREQGDPRKMVDILTANNRSIHYQYQPPSNSKSANGTHQIYVTRRLSLVERVLWMLNTSGMSNRECGELLSHFSQSNVAVRQLTSEELINGRF